MFCFFKILVARVERCLYIKSIFYEVISSSPARKSNICLSYYSSLTLILLSVILLEVDLLNEIFLVAAPWLLWDCCSYFFFFFWIISSLNSSTACLKAIISYCSFPFLESVELFVPHGDSLGLFGEED